jgi:E3 ubiquitin-protein ligase listerin
LAACPATLLLLYVVSSTATSVARVIARAKADKIAGSTRLSLLLIPDTSYDMVKGNPKSSASSGTRKKYAKRAAAQNPADEPEQPTEKKAKGKEKGKKEPRQKMYIPPVKPAPPQPDPLDTSGLAHSLPPELLVVLRSLGKKAEVTKIRALEDLQLSWVDKYKDGEQESIVYALAEMLPVWVRI